MDKVSQLNFLSLKTTLAITLCLFTFSCASRMVCNSVTQEPVSMCRAEAYCGRGSAGMVIGTILSGFNTNPNARNAASDRYQQCVESNLSAQRSSAGVPSNDYNCRTVEVSPGRFESSCNQK